MPLRQALTPQPPLPGGEGEESEEHHKEEREQRTGSHEWHLVVSGFNVPGSCVPCNRLSAALTPQRPPWGALMRSAMRWMDMADLHPFTFRNPQFGHPI